MLPTTGHYQAHVWRTTGAQQAVFRSVNRFLGTGARRIVVPAVAIVSIARSVQQKAPIAPSTTGQLQGYRLTRVGHAIPGFESVAPRVIMSRAARIHGFALQRQNTKDAFMRPAQRFFADEPLQRLNPEREFTAGERPLRANSPGTPPFEILRQQILGTIDDAQVFWPSALDRRLRGVALLNLISDSYDIG